MNVRSRIKHGEELFKSAVERRIVADVPVGAYLSGGLDSSLVVAAMRAARGPSEEIHTFSVGFNSDPHSELAFAQQVAEHLKTRHHVIHVGPDDFVRRWGELSALRHSPLSEPAEVGFAQMSLMAKPWVTVALSGEGADEIFAGYPKYRFAGAPRSLGLALRLLGQKQVTRLSRWLGLDVARATIAASALSQRTEVARLAQWFSDTRQDTLRSLLPGLDWSDIGWAETHEAWETALAETRCTTALGRMQAADCLTWLPGNILPYGDRMSMAQGLEMRLPFLDKAMVTFGLSLPDNLKIRGGEQKWLMRQWSVGNLPPAIIARRKWGFRVPLAPWFRGPMRSFLMDHLTDPRGICATYGNLHMIEKLAQSHVSGRVNASATLWKLLSTEVWRQRVLFGAQPSIR